MAPTVLITTPTTTAASYATTTTATESTVVAAATRGAGALVTSNPVHVIENTTPSTSYEVRHAQRDVK